MKTLDELWEEWVQQTNLLRAQASDSFQVLKEMVDVALQGDASDPDEVDEILIELAMFGDHYPPARDFLQEVSEKLVQIRHLPIFAQSGIVQALIEEHEKTKME